MNALIVGVSAILMNAVVLRASDRCVEVKTLVLHLENKFSRLCPFILQPFARGVLTVRLFLGKYQIFTVIEHKSIN